MQPQALLSFSEAERPLGDRLLKLARETDRVEGYTEPHAVLIAQYAEKIGAQMGLHGLDLTALKFAGLAHDLGERALKRNYLLSPEGLTWEQTLDLWRHPILGEQAAAELRLPRHTQLLIRWHHEWWNGQGYPDGLANTAIPLGARILRTVDTYCALIADRPHRNHYAPADAEQLVADLAGIEFDPQVVKCLLAILAEERQHHAPELWQVPPAFAPVASVTPEETDVETVPLAPVTNELPFLTESVAESFSASPARVEEFSESEAVATDVSPTALMPESAPDTTYDVAPEPAEQMPALEVVEADFPVASESAPETAVPAASVPEPMAAEATLVEPEAVNESAMPSVVAEIQATKATNEEATNEVVAAETAEAETLVAEAETTQATAETDDAPTKPSAS